MDSRKSVAVDPSELRESIGHRLILAIDTASPTVSVAVGRGRSVLAQRSVELKRSSEQLIERIDQVLAEAGLDLTDLAGVVALQGPGSFTGLRVGLATVLGFHQVLAIPATALPSLAVLAQWARRQSPSAGGCLAVVDALRGDWFVQLRRWQGLPQDPPEGLRSEPSTSGGIERSGAVERLRSEQLVARIASEKLPAVGFGASALSTAVDGKEALSAQNLMEPDMLAGAAIELATGLACDWPIDRLLSPLYLSAPAVTLPTRS